MNTDQNKKYVFFGVAGVLMLGGFVYFLVGSDAAKEAQIETTVMTEQLPSTTSESIAETSKADRFASLSRNGFFAYDSAELSSEASSSLSFWVEKLTENKSMLVNIEGHCDERGSESYNLNLGKARAKAVRDFLVSKGIDGARIHTISFGESSPSMKGSNESAYAQNRRFELKEVSTFAQN